MKKIIAVIFALMLLVSCGTSKSGNANDGDTIASDSNEDSTVFSFGETLWERNGATMNCSSLSQDIYSIDNGLYVISSGSLELLTSSTQSLMLSDEVVTVNISEDMSGNLKYFYFSGANREAIRIDGNKAIIADFYANQVYVYDSDTNAVIPVLSDEAYGFSYDEYETLAGKYDTIVWLDVPTVNDDFDRIAYWSNKYAVNGEMSLTPGIWVVNLEDGDEYRIDLGDLTPTVGYINWVDNETLMFSTEDGEFYKLSLIDNTLEALELPSDIFISVSNGYAVYKTDASIVVNDLSQNAITEYKITEPISFDKVFEKDGIIAFSSLKDGSIWTISTESQSLNTYEVILEDGCFAHLNGWSEDGLVIEVLNISTNEVDKIYGMPTGGLK